MGAALAVACSLAAVPAQADGLLGEQVAQNQPPARQTDTRPSLSEARQAFLDGRELMKREEYEAAVERFEYALQAKRTPGLLYYVAFGLEKSGRLVEALDRYQQASDLLKTEDAYDVEALIPEAIDRVQERIPRLVLEGVEEPVQVLVDGEPREGEQPFMVDPGEHELVVNKEGYEPFVETFQAQERQTEVVSVQLTSRSSASPEPPPPVAPAAPEEEDRGTRSHNPVAPYLFWGGSALALGGAATGIAGVIIAGNEEAAAQSHGEDIDELSNGAPDACLDPSGDLATACNDLTASLERANRAETLTVVGLSVAGVAAATAVTSYILWPESALSFSGGATPEAAWVSIHGTF